MENLFSTTSNRRLLTLRRTFQGGDITSGFWETVIVEALPEKAVNETYNRNNFWWPPKQGHPRSTHKENDYNLLRDSKSWMNPQGYGIINRSENPENILSDFWGKWGDDDIYNDSFKINAPTYYLALPIRKGGFQLGDHFWLDPLKPIRAVYFPVFFEESETYSRYGVYVKLDLLHLEKNHGIGPDVTCPKGWRKLGHGRDENGWDTARYELGSEGVSSWSHTLVIDVIKYISLATVPYDRRKTEPITAVKYTDPRAIQTGNVDEHTSWKTVSVSWATVQSFETGKKIKEDLPPSENYIARSISVISFAGSFIPIVGPVMSKGLDVVEKQMRTGERPDPWELIGIPKKAWDGIDGRPKKDLVDNLWKMVDFIQKQVLPKKK